MSIFSDFNDPLFSVTDLTDYIDQRKYVSRMLTQLLQVEARGVITDTIMIEARQRTLNVLPFVARGGDPTRREVDKRTARSLTIPAIKAARRIPADMLLKVRAPGELRKWGYRELVNEALTDMLDELQNTKEVLLSYLLKGKFTDADTGTEHYDYFTEEGISQEAEIDFDLDNLSPAQGALTQVVNVMKQTMRDNAEDIDVSRVIGLCSDGFWNLLVSHKEVIGTYAVDVGAGSERLNRDVSEGAFTWRGVTWISCGRTVSGKLLVPADKVLLFPATPGLFQCRYAPPDFFVEDLSNEVMGREMYVPPITIDPMHPNAPEWAEIELRSFPIYYPRRASVLMRGKKT
jgi:hypothetical protein